jgi:hypothetical protein
MREESIDLRLASQDATRHTREQGIRKIAEVRGRSYGFVSNLLKESGVELRGRGGGRYNSKIKKAARKKAGVYREVKPQGVVTPRLQPPTLSKIKILEEDDHDKHKRA